MPATPLRDWGGNESKRETARNCFFPIFVKNRQIVGFGEVCEPNYHPKSSNIEKDGVVSVYPIDGHGIERKWRFARQSIEEIKDELECESIKEEIVIKRYKSIYRYKTVWTDSKFNSNIWGSKLVKEITGTNFPFPKSIYNIKECIEAVAKNKKEAIILDYFAGSGTTGHAVLELNKEDGGNRKFILCTNNENKICGEVTYPRIQKVIKGYKKNGNGEKVAGLGGNLQYFKTELIKKTNNKDQARFDLTQKCAEMLCVKENIFNLKIEKEDYKIFSSNKADKFLCVYFNLYDKSFEDFLKEIKKLKGEKKIYVFSIDGKVDKRLFTGIKDFDIEEIPQKIIDIYKQLVKLNK
jgi:adenine-specific DNA-methyltransferase